VWYLKELEFLDNNKVNMLKVVTVVQQIITELSEATSEEDNIRQYNGHYKNGT
jgi:hypothetical protein